MAARLAEEENVDVGLLANYLAFRLQIQGIHWWGAAANLQRDGDDPWTIARDVFCERFSFVDLDEVDGLFWNERLRGSDDEAACRT